MLGARSLASLMMLLGVLAGCGEEPASNDAAVEPEVPPPSPGASAPPASPHPDEPMDQLEQSVADRLAPRLVVDGLHLDYVDCPRWPEGLPAAVECRGYVDGVVGDVDVELTKSARGRVEFDARLDDGILATRRLVERLEHEGYTRVDCGNSPVYPAQPGLRIVCRVHSDGQTLHMGAEVTDGQGAVRIEKW